MKLLFPDPCWKKDTTSGAVFLYFHDEKVGLTLHASVSTFSTGIDPFDFVRFVECQKPGWLAKFSEFVQIWKTYRSCLQETSDLLKPLHGVGFTSIWMSYPRGETAWQSAEELLSSSDLQGPQIANLIDPFPASDELFSHIFFERYLEIYEAHRTAEELIHLGAEAARSGGSVGTIKVDWRPLFEYCDHLFGTSEFEMLLARAYMFRLLLVQDLPAVLLSNAKLVRFLASLPVETDRARGSVAADVDFDVIAWEFFRQLVSPRLDPLDAGTVQRVAGLIQDHAAEIDALKRRCLRLARDLGNEEDLERLQKSIAQHIRANVEAEVQAVLSLDREAVGDLLDSVFSDEKTWLSIAGFMYSLLQGGPALTAGAALYALSSIGSKAVKAAADRRQKLRKNEYALLYRMRQ